MIPDWQLPLGVDRGLWDYLHASDMIASYDEQMCVSPLAAADVAFCERAFPAPGRLVDLGCGTGRLCIHFAARGYECVGVDLSEEMLAHAHRRARGVSPLFMTISGGSRPPLAFVQGNIADPSLLEDERFDYAACLFSTLGMIRGATHRAKVITNAHRLLKPGGRFVLHAHNRYFRGLGRKRVLGQRWKSLLGKPDAGDIAMPQAYAGAPLTLHHFTLDEIKVVLGKAGFELVESLAFDEHGMSASGSRVYGWLVLARFI